jgi:hypothetical protein
MASPHDFGVQCWEPRREETLEIEECVVPPRECERGKREDDVGHRWPNAPPGPSTI